MVDMVNLGLKIFEVKFLCWRRICSVSYIVGRGRSLGLCSSFYDVLGS